MQALIACGSSGEFTLCVAVLGMRERLNSGSVAECALPLKRIPLGFAAGATGTVEKSGLGRKSPLRPMPAMPHSGAVLMEEWRDHSFPGPESHHGAVTGTNGSSPVSVTVYS